MLDILAADSLATTAGGANGWMIVAALFVLYWLPTFLGWRKRNRRAILTLNLLAGWTGIGWLVALIWALTRDAEPLPAGAAQ